MTSPEQVACNRTTERNYYNPITSDDKHPLIIIDTMNGFFKWYKKSLVRLNKSRRLPYNRIVDYGDKFGMSALTATFETTFREYIRKLLRMTQTTVANVVLALDCRRSRVWRNDFTIDARTNLSTYKATRNTSPDPGISTTIRFMFDDMLPRLLPNHCIGVPRAEADDVIAVITRLVNARSPARPVYIVSDDSDFIQLLDHGTNEIYTQRHERTRDRCLFPARTHLLIKVIGGDFLDNIRPAFPNCSKRLVETLAGDPERLAKMVATHGDEYLKLNRKLIDFDYIPPTIKSRIIERSLLLRVKHRLY